MTDQSKLTGIHHITAITSSASENLRFYETVLGLRLVKQTVNFDDPYTYHLYYGNAQGSPGTILTFFPWEKLPPGKTGSGMVTAVNFAIPRSSTDFWVRRLSSNDIPAETVERFGEPVIQFSDPHGLPLELTAADIRYSKGYWQGSPIDETHAIAGLHSATATLNSITASQTLLTDSMGLSLFGQEGNRYRFEMEGPGPGSYYDLVEDAGAPSAGSGNGTVHHIAFRTPNDATQAEWQSALRAAGVAVTNVRDRQYFRSIYFNAPEGVLFEIATDPPGFTVDEPVDALGASLKLPGRLEGMRSDIQGQLPPLRSETFRHVFHAPRSNKDDGMTLVPLHGTGGDEHDLIPLAAQASPASAILSPRGNVSENGMLRFFKRLSINTFDEKDVIQKAHALSEFIISATLRHGRDPARVSAMGYSNGANIAAAVLLLRPEVFFNAVLLRPMLPLGEFELPDLTKKRILILRGGHDRVIPAGSTDRLEAVLRSAGAHVSTQNINAGHEISVEDLQALRRWNEALQDGPQDPQPETMVEATA